MKCTLHFLANPLSPSTHSAPQLTLTHEASCFVTHPSKEQDTYHTSIGIRTYNIKPFKFYEIIPNIKMYVQYLTKSKTLPELEVWYAWLFITGCR